MQEKKLSPFAERILKTLFDPVLWYTTLMITAIMYHYYDERVIGFFVAAFSMTYLMFRLFDFINRKKLIGGIMYIAAGYISLFAIPSYFIERGYAYYDEVLKTKPMSYGLWFITPQLAMDYNIWYSRATFMLFGFFLMSVIYYFSRVRYRVFMNFVIFIIPFMIYGKEYETMPIIFIILLTTSYIMLMFYCRQLKDDSTTVIVSRREILSSAGVFAIIFAILASIVPKPEIKEDREAIESLISAERFTDRLVASLSSFKGTTSGGQFRGVNSQVQLYYAELQEFLNEPMKLKTRTFSEYSYQYDSWSAAPRDSETVGNYDGAPMQISENCLLTNSLQLAVSVDPEFAEKYGLSEFATDKIRVPKTSTMRLYSVYQSGKNVPVPQYAQELTDSSTDYDYKLGKTGTISTMKEIPGNEDFTFEYGRDTFFSFDYNKAFIDAISGVDYSKLLIDASDVLYKKLKAADDSEEASKYLKAYDAVEGEISAFRDARSLLNYDDKVRIKELSDEITSGIATDYDKAKAIEWYFFNNNYNYDLEYVKASGENVENFIFNSKRGVCYEYATAMIMLSRAAGIPARYCEGFNLSRYQMNEKVKANYVITAMDAHGYPELYIKGYGWMPFEPTRSDGTEEQRQLGEAKDNLSKAGIVILIAAVLALILYIASPVLLHRFFLILERRKIPAAAVIAAMQRICRIYGLEKSMTSGEAAEKVRELSGADISALVVLFDRAAYGSEKLSEAEKTEAVRIYTEAYEKLRESRKKKRRLKVKNT